MRRSTPGLLVTVVCATGCLAGDHVAGPQAREAAPWPGSVSGDGVASIRNLQTGSTVAAPMTAGGFDPVAIAAQAGDTLAIQVAIAGTERVLRFAPVVALAARPIVVRTDPPPRKRDVPLNSQMFIVFSEPIDVSTVSNASIRLLKDSQPVSGSFAFPDTNHLTAAFTPLAALESGSAYSRVIGEGVLELDGDSLSAPVVVDFITEATAASELRFSVQPSATGVGLKLTPGVRLVATDGAGNAVTSFAGVVSVAIGAGPAGAVLSGTTSVQAVNGVATFGDLSLDQSGSGFTLTARSGGLSAGSSTEFSILSPNSSASSIVFNRFRHPEALIRGTTSARNGLRTGPRSPFGAEASMPGAATSSLRTRMGPG